jgi:hypothetical protein
MNVQNHVLNKNKQQIEKAMKRLSQREKIELSTVRSLAYHKGFRCQVEEVELATKRQAFALGLLLELVLREVSLPLSSLVLLVAP